MKVGFISSDWSDIPDPETGWPTSGGAGWYRAGMPSRELAKNGIETVHCELVSLDRRSGSNDGLWLHDFDENPHPDCDVIVVQRWMDYRAPDACEFARACGQIIVNDVDDWYWGLDHRNDAYWASDPRNFKSNNRDHYLRALRASDAITVSTPFLQEKIRGLVPELADRVFLVRNAIDLARWSPNPVREVPETVGWVGSTRHRSGDLEVMKGLLGPFCERHGLKFVHAGPGGSTKPAWKDAGVKEESSEWRPGVSIVEYPALFEGFDIGIAPLNDVPFNHAKSHVKPSEYAAAGIPFIASALPEYEYVESLGMGVIARKPHQWRSWFEKMLDPRVREEHAAGNREAVERLDIAHRWVDWAEVYRYLVG